MLIGLITKNGILIVEFANRLRSRGSWARAAVQEAAALRLRPILMTTSAMILGALPLALAGGPGAESREPIGWVIVGGLSLRHPADAVRDPDGLYAPGPPALHARRRNRIRRGGQGRITSLGQNSSAPHQSSHPPAPDARRCIARMRSGRVMSARLPRY